MVAKTRAIHGRICCRSHLKTRLIEEFGVETPDRLIKAQKSMFKTTTVNRYLRQWGYDHETLRRQRSAFKPNTATTAGNST